MIRIAIVDDEKEQVSQIKEVVAVSRKIWSTRFCRFIAEKIY